MGLLYGDTGTEIQKESKLMRRYLMPFRDRSSKLVANRGALGFWRLYSPYGNEERIYGAESVRTKVLCGR